MAESEEVTVLLIPVKTTVYEPKMGRQSYLASKRQAVANQLVAPAPVMLAFEGNEN